MIDINTLTLINYCHNDCTPLLNIMRLPKSEAFALAKQMAEAHPQTTAFGRFADFENYYALRVKQDRFLYEAFRLKGGEPEELHPLSFVVEGSDYLSNWFGNGIVTKLPLAGINSKHISFTIGDSGGLFGREDYEVLTKEELESRLGNFEGSFAEFMTQTGKPYIETQLWSDRYLL